MVIVIKNLIDLHTHSNASDGSLSPSALIAEAAKRGISTLALTDHDTLGGLEEGEKAAFERGLRFIPGIELEIEKCENIQTNPDGEFHLLGLGINRPTGEFIESIKELSRRRKERNLEIAERINSAGISISYEEIETQERSKDYAGAEKVFSHSIGRPHFAAFLVKKKIVRTTEQAFDRYLARGKPFYIPKVGMKFENAIKLIHESGGIAVLAHPMSLYIAWGRLDALLANLKEMGLDGIEAWHPAAKVSFCRRLTELGKKLEFFISAGSDFHGVFRPDRKLGITAGGKKIDRLLVEPFAKNQEWALYDSNI